MKVVEEKNVEEEFEKLKNLRIASGGLLC